MRFARVGCCSLAPRWPTPTKDTDRNAETIVRSAARRGGMIDGIGVKTDKTAAARDPRRWRRPWHRAAASGRPRWRLVVGSGLLRRSWRRVVETGRRHRWWPPRADSGDRLR